MRSVLARRPSASMVVALAALVVAASGTAVAAGNLVTGDNLVKKNSLSGNRLRNHTITATQVNMKKLGKVPNAHFADRAFVAGSSQNAVNAQDAAIATNAKKADSAATAVTASNAITLAGQPSGAFESSSNFTRSGIVGTNVGGSTTLATFGPFTLTLKCVDSGGGSADAEIFVSSSAPSSEANGTPLPNASTFESSGASTSFQENASRMDFIAPAAPYFGDLLAAVHNPASTSTCMGLALVSKS